MQTKNKRLVGGFTLIELLIVIAILALLASFVIVVSIGRGGTARDGIRKANLRQLSDYLRGYYFDHGFTYPSGGPYFSTDPDPWIPGLDDYNKPLPKDPKQASLINSLAGNFRILLSNENIMIGRLARIFADLRPQIKVVYAATVTDQPFTANLNDAKVEFFRGTTYPADPLGSCNGAIVGNSYEFVGQRRLGSPVPTWYSDRVYFEFDTSGIPDGATITGAKLRLTILYNLSATNFNIIVRSQDWGQNLDCSDYSPLGAVVNNTYNTSGLPAVNNSFDLIFSPGGLASINTNGVSRFSVASENEEADSGAFSLSEHIAIYMANSTTTAYKPQLLVSYTTPDGGGGPGPGDPGYGICGEDPKVFCYAYYYNSIGDNTYTLWTNMERDDDKQIYNGELATCRENPPLGKPYFDYCTK